MENIPFYSRGNDEVGEPVGTYANCPKCAEKKLIEYGERILQNGTRMPSDLGYIQCDCGTFLVSMNGQYINKKVIPSPDEVLKMGANNTILSDSLKEENDKNEIKLLSNRLYKIEKKLRKMKKQQKMQATCVWCSEDYKDHYFFIWQMNGDESKRVYESNFCPYCGKQLKAKGDFINES